MTRVAQGRNRRQPAWAGFLNDLAPRLSKEEALRFSGKRVLVTGAGGFLGSAIARQVARLDVAHLTLLDLSEYGLYRLDERLRAVVPGRPYALIVGSVSDPSLLGEVFGETAPDIIFHAAARKHVPLMEGNIFSAAETNALGTMALVQAAERAHTQSFVLLSTDKAVAPISTMGKTKRIAEQIVLGARERQANRADFKCVRLCNVLGSTGSVAPLFVRQIKAGGPVTVTHPEATRYFLSPRDAVRHLLRAAVTITGTGLLIPHVGRAVRVEDLALFLLKQSSRVLHSGIIHTGLRAADKLHEQLLSDTEQIEGNAHGSVREVRTSFNVSLLNHLLPVLANAVETRNRDMLLATMKQLVPEHHAPKPLTRESLPEPQ